MFTLSPLQLTQSATVELLHYETLDRQSGVNRKEVMFVGLSRLSIVSR